MHDQPAALRLAARYRLAGFIPDKFFKTTKAELQRVLKEPAKEPWDISHTIHDKVVPLFKRFMDQLLDFGMHRHAVDSVKSRLELRLEMLERIASAWSQFEGASRAYRQEKDAQAETELAIHIAIREMFEAQIKTVGKGLTVVWQVDPDDIPKLAQQILRKATAEELAAIDAAAHDDWSNVTLNTKYKFYERVKLAAKARRLVKKEPVKASDWARWFESVRALLEANYTQEALAKVEGFDDFKLGNLRVIVLDPKVNHFENHGYAKVMAHAQTLLKQKGFGKLWYGVIFVESASFKKLDEASLKAYRELGYQTLESTAGTYHDGSDVVKITAPPGGLVKTVVHEMGHRYWYKFMKPEQRARFNGLVKTNPAERSRDFPSGPTEEGVEKPVTPVSTYGQSTIEEAFAEVFAHYVMGKDMDRDQLESFKSVLSSEERVIARYAAQIIRIDGPWLTKMRKDFLTLMKNIPRVKDYKTAMQLKEAFKHWRLNQLDEVFFQRFLNKSLKYDETISPDVRRYIDSKLRKPGWDLFAELEFPIQRADDYWTEGARFANYEREVRTWEQRVRRKAQVFWRELKDAITYYEDAEGKIRYKGENEPPTLQTEVPYRERQVIEGFQVIVQGFGDSNTVSETLGTIQAGFRLYRRNAKQRLPLLIQKQVPVFIEFEATLDKGGEYHSDGTITFYASSVISENPNRVAHVMAHEMGHHLWKTVLSGSAQMFWEKAIKGDYGSLDVRKLVNNWPGDAWAFQFPKVLGDKDPLLALQVEALSHDPSYGGRDGLQSKEDFERLLSQGIETVVVPKTPITGYANKNPQEAFCEAIGLFVSYGPRAVPPKIRGWLNIVLPGQVKTARAIRLDKWRIKELAKELEVVLGHKARGDQPLGNRVLVPAAPYTITAVDGTSLDMYIRLNAVETKSPYYVVDGGYGIHQRYQAPIVVVNVNGSMAADKLGAAAKARQVQNQLFPVLLHEMTHAADKYSRGVGQEMSREEAQGNEDYYNNPSEVRAYMQEVVDEIDLKHWPTFQKMFGPSKGLEYLLKSSPTWQEVSPYWTERNKRLVIKAVAQAINDWEASTRVASRFRAAGVLSPTDEKAGWAGGTLYHMPLSKDVFVHFTLKSRVEQILSSGKLLMRPPYKKFGVDHVAAVSAVWGWFVPTVQTSHIKVPPGDELAAIVFKTSTQPQQVNFPEEVTWDRDVALQNARVVSAAQGASLIRKAPEKLPDEQDGVTYG